MRRRSSVFAIVVLLAIGAGAWWLAVGHPPPPIGIVVITLDTTRADHLSPYGYMNVSLPHLERLAREGVLFDQATSVAPLTLPAHSTIFTGRLPPHHGVRDNADKPLAESQTTLAEVLRERGFRTGAFVGSIVLNRERGLAQGFEHYSGVAAAENASAPASRQRPGDEVMNDAIAWLDSVGSSQFFLWAHLYDPHRPYDPPDPYRAQYAHNPYVGEIAFADSQVGRLIDALEKRRLLDRTVVIVTADHGESLGAHGERDHGIFIYEEVVRVPLIVRAAGLRPARVGHVVRLTDVMPTVLELAQVPGPATDGISLVELMRGRTSAADLEAYSESLYPERLGWSALRALRTGRFKLIDAPRPELYDLEQDPFEEQNIYEQRRATADSLRARLVAIGTGPALGNTAAGEATPERQAQLGALGYLASSRPRGASSQAPRPDPKDCIGHLADAATAAVFAPGCGQRARSPSNPRPQ